MTDARTLFECDHAKHSKPPSYAQQNANVQTDGLGKSNSVVKTTIADIATNVYEKAMIKLKSSKLKWLILEKIAHKITQVKIFKERARI